jgi:histidyl-tRNA synthetase
MKPSIPRGTRDFGPAEMQKRQYILNLLRRNFELFGFAPIETPAMENIGTLTGKYGEEGDQLIFKILNSRVHEAKEADKETMRKEFDLSLFSSRNTEALTEKALRYDLTVPFARFVVMNQHQLSFPFRRYQIQSVWRADKPQKGRYREFYQCDADVIGSTSLTQELDLISLMDKSFQELHLPVILKFNNRKILSAIAALIDAPEKIIDLTVAIDKLDKIGKEKVLAELTTKGLSSEAIAKVAPLLDFSGTNEEKLIVLEQLLGHLPEGQKGLEEIRYLLNGVAKLKIDHLDVELDITLARGLNYYTGTIFEVKSKTGSLSSSILGGGRYDDLTGIFGLANMSGVGISFGIDRIYDVLEELQLFPAAVVRATSAQLLFTHFDADSQMYCLELAADLRRNGIACEVYSEAGKKLGKQFEYANKKMIPFVCTIGSEEMTTGVFTLKNMETGVQQKLNHKDLIEYIRLNA